MKKTVLGVLSLALIAIIAMSMQHLSKDTADYPQKDKGYQIGDTATDFKLKNVDGQMVSLSDMSGAKGFIITFTCNECPFAIKYEDRLIALHNEYAPKGYPVVAINPNDPKMSEGETFEAMQVRAKEKAFPFTYLVDEDQKVFPQYGATKTPHVFLLDKDMKVQYIGAIDDNANSPEDVEVRYVANAINALENNQLPDPNFTKAIGCGIKSDKIARGNKGGGPDGNARRKPPTADEMLQNMDSNKDDKISKSEAQGPLQRNFDSLDKNEDGFLTKEELAEMKPPKRK